MVDASVFDVLLYVGLFVRRKHAKNAVLEAAAQDQWVTLRGFLLVKTC